MPPDLMWLLWLPTVPWLQQEEGLLQEDRLEMGLLQQEIELLQEEEWLQEQPFLMRGENERPGDKGNRVAA